MDAIYFPIALENSSYLPAPRSIPTKPLPKESEVMLKDVGAQPLHSPGRMEALVGALEKSIRESNALILQQTAAASVAAPGAPLHNRQGQKEVSPFLAQFGSEWVSRLLSSLAASNHFPTFFCRFPRSDYQVQEFPK